MNKHAKKIKRSSQYDHMQGNPLDPANHPATMVPDATMPYSGVNPMLQEGYGSDMGQQPGIPFDSQGG